MRTFGTLLAGWVLGGLAIVLMTAPAPQAQLAAPRAMVYAVPGTLKPALLMPVLGVPPEKLRDTYSHPRSRGRTHHALDIMAPRGTPVIAAVDGRIRKLFTSKGGGISIYQFDASEEHVYYYAHLDRYADGLREGQIVTQGSIIGYVGTTGNAPPTAPHLHFAIEVLPPTKEWWKGEPVNPYPLLTARASEPR